MTTTSVSDNSSLSSVDSTQASPQVSDTSQVSSGKKNDSSTISTQSSQQDQVKISAAAEAHALKSQGQSVSQIAQSLGVTAKVVDSYLGIQTVSSGSGGAAAQYSASQVTQLLGGL